MIDFGSSASLAASVGYSNWCELNDKLVAISRRGTEFVGLGLYNKEIQVQIAKPAGRSSKIEALIPVNSAIDQNLSACLILCDDGSLSRFDLNNGSNNSPSNSVVSTAPQNTLNPETITTSEISTLIEERKRRFPTPQTTTTTTTTETSTSSTQKFPITFFEDKKAITQNVTLAGDITKHYTSDVAKQRLASNDAYLVSPKSDSFTIEIKNNQQEMVMVGLRVLFGHASHDHIPTHIQIFDRTIDIQEGQR